VKDAKDFGVSGAEQQEAAFSHLVNSGFIQTTKEVLQKYPPIFTFIPVRFGKDGNCEVETVKGKPYSAGLVVKWSEIRYPHIKNQKLLDEAIEFKAIIIESNAEGEVVIKGRNQVEGLDWNDVNSRQSAVIQALEEPKYCIYSRTLSDEERGNLFPLDIPAGPTIENAAIRMVKIAESTGKEVIADFNEIGLSAKPGDSPGQLVERFHAERARRKEEELNTPEGERFARKLKFMAPQEQEPLSDSHEVEVGKIKQPFRWGDELEPQNKEPKSEDIPTYTSVATLLIDQFKMDVRRLEECFKKSSEEQTSR